MTGRWKPWHLVLFSLLSLPLLVAGECEDDPPTTGGNGNGDLVIPSSWANTYRVEATGTIQRGTTQVSIDVLCAGDDAVVELFSDDIADYTCTGTIDDGGAAITCIFEDKIFPGCDEVTEAVFTATRDGATGDVAGTISVSTTLEGDCSPRPAGNEGPQVTTFEATVIDDESPGCASGFEDVVHEAWGGEWELMLTEIDCGSGVPTGKAGTFTPLFCPGDPATTLLSVPEKRLAARGQAIEVWGGFSSDAVNAFFYEPRTNGGFCQEGETWHFELDRDGETMTGVVEAIEYVFGDDGKCVEDTVSVCVEVTGTRLSTDTSGCIPPR